MAQTKVKGEESSYCLEIRKPYSMFSKQEVLAGHRVIGCGLWDQAGEVDNNWQSGVGLAGGFRLR